MLLRNQITRFVAVAALLGGIATYSPAFAQNNGMSPAGNGMPDATTTDNADTSSPAMSAAPTPASDTSMNSNNSMSSSGMKSSKHMHGAENMSQKVEDRITSLHSKLMITADQESAWGQVASAMRDNESNMSSLIEARHAQTNPTALEDMQSYQKISQAHADGLAKVINAFTPLYNSMSATQKANADAVFSGMGKHHEMKKHHGHKAAPAPSAQ